MVFTVYADDTLIHHSQSPSGDVKLVTPVVVTEVSAAGSFTCKIPPSNVGYNSVDRFTSIIRVFRDDKLLFEGRIIEESQDFYKNRSITCEGALSYLNDTTQPPAEYHNQTVRGFLETLISIHNNKVDSTKTLRVGVVTVTDPNNSIYRYTNFESTLECIKDKLLDRLGGYLVMRYEDGVRYLDYLAEPVNTNTQTIEFGKNLLTFSKSWDYSDFATVVVPQGERLEESPIEALDAYLDVKSVNSGSIYVYDQNTVDNYGWIEVVVKWNDVSDPTNLLNKARTYLSNIQFDNLKLELTAVDLSYLGGNVENIEVFDKIRCVSTPHGMDRFFTVTKVQIPMDNPANTRFTLGDNKDKISLSASIRNGDKKLQSEIDNMPSTTSVLDEAYENAGQLINRVSNGYITTVVQGTGENAHSEELIISDTQNYLNASHYWKWNINGLAHFKRVNGQMVISGIAMTMDGKINADMITTGHLVADRISGGILTDLQGNMTWNLNTGVMTATNLTIDTPKTYIDHTGVIISGSTETERVIIDDGEINFYLRTSNVGTLCSDHNGGLALIANHLYINGVEASTSDTSFLRSSNGQVAAMNFTDGIYTGTSFSGDTYDIIADLTFDSSDDYVANMSFDSYDNFVSDLEDSNGYLSWNWRTALTGCNWNWSSALNGYFYHILS